MERQTTNEVSGNAAMARPQEERGQRLLSGLSAKLLTLTIIFVMLAEVLIFIPSVANMRLRWLQDRLNTAAAAGIVVDGMQIEDIPDSVLNDTLMAAGARTIALRREGTSRLLATAGAPVEVAAHYDLAAAEPFSAIRDGLETLLFGGGRLVRVFGPVGETDMIVDLVLDETALRNAMFVYSRNVFFLSIVVSAITSTLIFFAIDRLMIRRIRRLTHAMQFFSRNPDRPDAVIRPDEGTDELALASRHLADMQQDLQKTLKSQRSLADLGLAVSKINHDMRNILATAQLMSDRLAEAEDPVVRNLAPKLLRTLDRAVGYTSEVLAYGQSSERPPRRFAQPLKPVVVDVRDSLGFEAGGEVELVLDLDDALEVTADAEQLFRVLHNLVRNAHQALTGQRGRDSRGEIRVQARRIPSGVEIAVSDNGPGLPEKARANLFEAFRGGARSGGTGLGLAIARDLVEAHGGRIELVDGPATGACFRIHLPDASA